MSTPAQDGRSSGMRSTQGSGIRAMIARHWALVLSAAVFIAGQWPVLSNWCAKYWNNMDGYYSHGVLVPFLVAFMVWLNIPRLRRVKIKGSWGGLLFLLSAIPVYVLGLLVKMQFLCGAAFMISVFGIAIVFLGFAATRILFLPLLFFVTMIPFADYVLDILTLRCQSASVTLAARAFTLLGFAVQQAGNTIMSGDLPQPLLVGIPCSGLKLFVTLVMCCWFLSYIIEAPRYKKAIIMALSLPLSIVCNTLRIIFIGLVGFHTFSVPSMDAFHDWSGRISILLCVAVLYGTMRLLEMRNLRSFEDGGHALPGNSGRSVNLFEAASVLVVLTISGVFGWTAASALSIPRGSLDRAGIPGKFGVWDSTNLVIDNKTKELLSQGDLLSRAYIDMSKNGRLVHVFITAAKESKAFHDPLMCLPAAGNVCLQDRLVKLQLGGKAPVEARLLRVSQDDGTYLVIYWYTAGDISWSDTSKVQIYMKRTALTDAVHILMNPFGMRKIRQKISARQFVFHRFAMRESGDKGDMAYLERFIGDFASHTGSIAK